MSVKSQAEKVPNFFIVGAPKCGTTALYSYLSEHPNIFLPKYKEPHFFSSDYPVEYGVRDEKEYMSLFLPVSDLHVAVGDASVNYMYSRCAIENIVRFNDSAKIIVMLRNPIEVAHATHATLLYNMYEDEGDFVKAWEKQESRAEGREIPKRCLVPEFLQYRKMASLGTQLERVFSVIPREQVLVLLYEEFFGDIRSQYELVLKFLGVPLDERKDFPRVNSNRYLRWRWLEELNRRIPGIVKMPLHWLDKVQPFPIAERLRRVYRGLNGKVRKREKLPPEFLGKLKNVFSEEVEKLGRLLGRDLRYWVE